MANLERRGDRYWLHTCQRATALIGPHLKHRDAAFGLVPRSDYGGRNSHDVCRPDSQSDAAGT